jgi:hypothetical protein
MHVMRTIGDSNSRALAAYKSMSRSVERAPGHTTRTSLAETEPIPGRTTRAAKDMPSIDEVPPIDSPIAPAGSPLFVLESIRRRTDWFVALREQLERVAGEGGGGMGADSLRAELAIHAAALSAYLNEVAPEIARVNHPAVYAVAIDAVNEIARAPIARSGNDRTIAQNLSSAGGAIASAFGVMGGAFGVDLPAGALIDILGSVAGIYAAFEHGISGRGNVGDAVSGAGALLGLIAAARGATWLGLGALVVESLGGAIGDAIRTQEDRDAVESALVRAGLEPSLAHALANMRPEAIRALRPLSSTRIVELAAIAPNVFVHPDPDFFREMISWGNDVPLTGYRLQALQNWNNFLR